MDRQSLCFQRWLNGPADAIAFSMILLVWSSERARECAAAMEYALHEPVQATTSFEQACEEVKKADFSLVVLDQWMSEVSPAGADSLFQNLGRAVPVVVNFAITGMDRVVAIVRCALERHVAEGRSARESASTMLRAQFKDDVTAVLLSCAVALQEPTLTPAAAERIRKVEELANRIRYKLQAGDTGKAGKAAHA